MTDDYGLVNCAGCQAELTGDRQKEHLLASGKKVSEIDPPPIEGRMNGRPYCNKCLRRTVFASAAFKNATPTNHGGPGFDSTRDMSGAQEIALRRMEDSQ